MVEYKTIYFLWLRISLINSTSIPLLAYWIFYTWQFKKPILSNIHNYRIESVFGCLRIKNLVGMWLRPNFKRHIVYNEFIVSPISMVTLTYLWIFKKSHHIFIVTLWTWKVPYNIYIVVATIQKYYV